MMFQGVLADVLDLLSDLRLRLRWVLTLERSLAQISLTNTWYRWSAAWTRKHHHFGDTPTLAAKSYAFHIHFHAIYPLDTQWTLEVHSFHENRHVIRHEHSRLFFQVVKLTNDPVPNVRFNAAKTILVRVSRLHNLAWDQKNKWRTFLVDPFIAIHSHWQTPGLMSTEPRQCIRFAARALQQASMGSWCHVCIVWFKMRRPQRECVTGTLVIYPKYPDPQNWRHFEDLIPASYRFKPFHWRVQWSLG